MFKKIAATYSAIGLALLMLPQPAFAQGTIGTLPNVNVQTPHGFFTDFSQLINGVLRAVLIIAALLVFAYLIMGGLEYITSGGDKGKTESARNKITSAIVGMIILAASYAILTVVLNFLGYAGGLPSVFQNP